MAEKDNSLRILLTGFKGKNNSSSILVQSISENYRLLTNSLDGLKKDMEEIDYYTIARYSGIGTSNKLREELERKLREFKNGGRIRG
jgi:hypothetical protein